MSQTTPEPSQPSESAIFTKDQSFYTTLPNNESPLPISHNEEMLSGRIESLSIYDPTNPRYQEHVCAIDFYKHSKAGQESAVVVKREDEGGDTQIESMAMESSDTGPTKSSSWRFESAVLWNEGGRGRETAALARREVGAAHGQKNETTNLVSSQTEGDIRQKGVHHAQEVIPLTTADTKKDVSGSRDVAPVPLSPSIDIVAEGAKIWDQICDSKSGWRYTFELFELGKVPDFYTFVIDVLGEFISRRQELWNRLESQGFNLKGYQESHEDELFMQNSYREATLEAVIKGDFERADKLFLKTGQVLTRRAEKGTKPNFGQAILIEKAELGILGIYLHAKCVAEGWAEGGRKERLSIYSLDNWDDLQGEYRVFKRQMSGLALKWLFQVHFMIMALRRGPSRYDNMVSYERWEPNFFQKVGTKVGNFIKDMEGIETLRLAADRDENTPTTGDWNAQMKVRFPISKSELYRLKRMGHKEMILENLATVYKPAGLHTGGDFDPEYKFEPSKVGTKTASLTSQSSSPEIAESLPTPSKPPKLEQRKSPWAISPTSPKPAVSQVGALTHNHVLRHIGEAERGNRHSLPNRTPPTSVHDNETKNLSSGQVEQRAEASRLAAMNQRMRNVADQPVVRAEECAPDRVQPTTDFKHAVRHVVDLDFYIGQLASLHLINFIRGSPEYKPWTPLIEAICNQRWEAAKKLINLGASFTLGYPFHTAISKHAMVWSRDLCQRIVSRGLIGPLPAGVDASSHFISESTSMIKYMVDAGMDVTARGVANTDIEQQIETYPIHLAALDTDPNTILVEYLIKNGARVWVKDRNGELPIDYARRAGNVRNIKLLEETGRKQSKGYT
ncbi:hypothetical protein TWF694_002991 [Orbilia ellipsospora]|uniref:Ankyrin repeat protein n=1 Tax=Orbilia ellipsospora TaxID=2528407 RepID=A0AAV9X0A8_9PEZI